MATKITIPVTGMHCAACQSRVQGALQKTAGVSDASVNLLLNSATITYDEGAVGPAKLAEVIRSTGYDAVVPSADTTADRTPDMTADNAAEIEAAELKRKTTITLV